MSLKDSNNLRIAKNSLFLYFRLILTLIVSLYSSRVVLDTLGIENYGIYSVVGGLVLMFTFLNSTLSAASSRFLTFELGKLDSVNFSKIFKSAITINISVALILLVFSETLGLWFFENKLVIPPEKLFAARFVYQISIITAILLVLRIPYNAAVIAHEKMSFFAYVSILEVFLKLIILYLLVIGDFDKLILYSLLIFFISIIINGFYIFYCLKKFNGCSFGILFEKNILTPMLSYSGWDLFGNFSSIAKNQGVNILLNLFFGPVINAATGIATQVQTAIVSFSENFLLAARPQIVKYYSSENFLEMNKLIFNASKYSFLLLFIISFPLILDLEYVLNVWLKNVPEYAIIFCAIALINNLLSVSFRPISFGIHATGSVKWVSIINSSIYLLVLPISYVLLELNYSPIFPFLVNLILLIFGCLTYLIIYKKLCPSFSIKLFLTNVVLKNLIVISISSIIPILFFKSLDEGFIRLLIVYITTLITTILFVYLIVLDIELKNQVISYTKTYFQNLWKKI